MFDLTFTWGTVVPACILGAACLLQLLFSLWIYLRTWSRSRAEERGRAAFAEGRPGVSVIVYAHNHAAHLMRHLPVLLASDYPDYEIIVIDDASTDETQDVLTMMEQRSDRFYYTRITDGVRTLSRRKLAVMLGVKAARHDIILSTEATCVPASPRWIECMVRNFTPSTEVVLGPACYEDRVGVAARFFAFDLFHRLVMLFGITMGVRPYAGCGMNLAFRKSTFFAHRGFSTHLTVRPGEDDLFVAEVATRRNTRVECSADAVVVASERPLRYSWAALRLNRAFTSQRYALAARVVYGLDVVTRYVMLAAGVACLVLWWGAWLWWGATLGVLVLLAALRVWIYNATARRLRMHHFLFSTMFVWILPFVDFWFKGMASLRRRTFDVGRI